jgi:hypothetical protein
MTTFAVDDVQAATHPVATRALRETRRDVLFLGGDPERRVLDSRVRDDESADLATIHPLIGAVSFAFSQHRTLVLTPDAIWLTIAQGVAQHVRDNAERLRSTLVRHAGRKEVTLRSGAFPETAEQWASVIDGLRDELVREIGDGRARLFECNFSTSTPTDLLASQVVLLDAYSPYFDYRMSVICGIPRITLTGTPEDWREIEKRLDILDELDLRPWCARLRPIIREMIATAEGRPNIRLWKRIYNPTDAYGGEYVTGWITRLYPTIGQARRPNPMLAYAMDEPKGVTALFKKVFAKDDVPGVRLAEFPATLSRVSLRITDDRAEAPRAPDRRVSLFAGLVAIAVDDTGAVCPISGWHVTSSVPLVELATIIRERYTTTPSQKKPRTGPFDEGPRDVVTVPEEVDELWAHLGSAVMFEGDRQWRIRQRDELLSIESPGRYWEAGAIADLPDGKSLCYWIGIGETRWLVCTLVTEDQTTRIVEPTSEVMMYGTSLVRLLERALATEGDISELRTASVATLL